MLQIVEQREGFSGRAVDLDKNVSLACNVSFLSMFRCLSQKEPIHTKIQVITKLSGFSPPWIAINSTFQSALFFSHAKY